MLATEGAPARNRPLPDGLDCPRLVAEKDCLLLLDLPLSSIGQRLVAESAASSTEVAEASPLSAVLMDSRGVPALVMPLVHDLLMGLHANLSNCNPQGWTLCGAARMGNDTARITFCRFPLRPEHYRSSPSVERLRSILVAACRDLAFAARIDRHAAPLDGSHYGGTVSIMLDSATPIVRRGQQHHFAGTGAPVTHQLTLSPNGFIRYVPISP